MSEDAPAIPAATVLLLKDNAGMDNAGQDGLNVLMLHKNSKMAFGGMWVFPGGKIDDGDYHNHGGSHGELDAAARNAAARETREEAGIRVPADDFVWFAHWMPPPSAARRYATWFFAAGTEGDQDVSVDGVEIQNHQWVNPADALGQHAAGKIDLAPPTWVSLYQLSRFRNVSDALSALADGQPRHYRTRVARAADGTHVALWAGDAGYDDWDANASGPTHRLLMKAGGFQFLHSAVSY